MLLGSALLLISFLTYSAFPQNDCPQNSYMEFGQVNCTSQANEQESYYYEMRDNCLPHCQPYPFSVRFGYDCPNEACPPSYNCEQRCKMSGEKCKVAADCQVDGNIRDSCLYCCVPSDGECMSYYANTEDFDDTYWTAKKFKPVCDNDGMWDAKQCKGGMNGRCMCFSSTGARIFGEALKSKADDMTCACSRRRADLKANGESFVSIHCDANGNFEKLQCNEGICWCADPKTGDPTAPVVPEKAMLKLPCYTKVEVGSQYLRQCESKEYAIYKLKEKLTLHGVRFIMTETIKCDWDGAYGPYMVSDTNAYCTWRNGSKIGTWQADITAYLSILNCNCARDSVRYAHNLQCTSYGNYESQQTLIDGNDDFYYYCVDSDGFAKTDIIPLIEGEEVDCGIYY